MKTLLRSVVLLAAATFATLQAQEPETLPDRKLPSPNNFNDGVVLAYVKGRRPVDGKTIEVMLHDIIAVRVRISMAG